MPPPDYLRLEQLLMCGDRGQSLIKKRHGWNTLGIELPFLIVFFHPFYQIGSPTTRLACAFPLISVEQKRQSDHDMGHSVILDDADHVV